MQSPSILAGKEPQIRTPFPLQTNHLCKDPVHRPIDRLPPLRPLVQAGDAPVELQTLDAEGIEKGGPCHHPQEVSLKSVQ